METFVCSRSQSLRQQLGNCTVLPLQESSHDPPSLLFRLQYRFQWDIILRRLVVNVLQPDFHKFPLRMARHFWLRRQSRVGWQRREALHSRALLCWPNVFGFQQSEIPEVVRTCGASRSHRLLLATVHFLEIDFIWVRRTWGWLLNNVDGLV